MPPREPAGNNGNLCEADCTVCGDAVVDADEQCDDGNGIDNDDCRNDCTIPVCGDGIVQSLFETCDDVVAGLAKGGDDLERGGTPNATVKSITMQTFTFTEFFYRCSATFPQVEMNPPNDDSPAKRIWFGTAVNLDEARGLT